MKQIAIATHFHMQIIIHALYQDNETDAKPEILLIQTHNNIDSFSNNVLNIPDRVLGLCFIVENNNGQDPNLSLAQNIG